MKCQLFLPDLQALQEMLPHQLPPPPRFHRWTALQQPISPTGPGSPSLEVEECKEKRHGVAHQGQDLPGPVQLRADGLLKVQSHLGQAPRGIEVHREVVGGCHVELKLTTHLVKQLRHSWES